MTASWGPGTLILNRYRLEAILGRGGMGSVWKAEHVQLKSPVAVKLLDPAIANNEHMLTRFLREAQSAAALRSPHVVQIFDYGVEEGTAFIAMEMLHGESLSDRIAKAGKLGAEDTFRFLQQVLRAMGKAHEVGIVHRDLKPDNIFICQDEPEFAKVLDFGVAKLMTGELGQSGGSRTQTGMMIGTPYYMSPEQTQAKEVDARADLWAIAVIAFECLTGRRPFMGDSFGELVIGICTKPVPVPSQVGPVPEGFDEWFVKATQRDRDRRFRSAREMADELAKVGDTAGAVARTSMPKAQQFSTAPRPVPAVATQDLQLTTGSGSVSSRSVGAGAPRASVAVLALAGVAALIVIGVGAFVAMGGPRALMKEPQAEVAPVISEPAPVAAALSPRLEPAALPAPAAAAAPAAVASVVSSSVAVANASASPAKVAAPARPGGATEKPRSSPAKPSAPLKAEPNTKAAPPKDWNF